MFPLAIRTLENNLKLTVFQNEILLGNLDTKFQAINCFVKQEQNYFFNF